MRSTAFIVLTVMVFNNQNPHTQLSNMDNKVNIQEVITSLFVNTDKRNWAEVEAQFAPKVALDYSSMTGNKAEELTPTQITEAWKKVLPGFTHTNHQIGNFITTVKNASAKVFCYGTATHYLKDSKGDVWIVVGSYDFNLEKSGSKWKIVSMTFNFKYQDGNEMLVGKAIENAKAK
ncbi:nuclear transport factor 2 family protein [Seonamhaeicola marinus]|uniref:Nuclear transport factor 2 family protein n=1 Tax=Seonamhaeicola marinus TaxID=1912246 RepID=A0A5D0H3T9_9FLAO|nr:nuclear transport factor 2 family protein [Seonamhaeicola marinus]TYA65948.1 nuclear transport factor 2 family protein [Seonamhaeicola marinus]